ncbi:MAG: outer membrane beta-barrel family protein, partial [Alistipes sp.]|nr:outer membrane beta-barrel family protein [Alistipes sp.]
PTLSKLSEYMYQTGNPDLKASYNNSVSLTAVLKYKYTISLGASFVKNSMQQTTVVDTENPNLLVLIPLNFPTLDNYYLNVNLPFQFTPWWSFNLNATGVYLGQQITESSPVERYFMGMYNGQMSFTLPKGFIVELSGYMLHGMVSGNVHLDSMGDMNTSVKKRLFNNKLTLSAGVNNILGNHNKGSIREAEFRRDMNIINGWSCRQFTFSVTYNFNAGKQFKARSVESGSAEDRGRLGSGSSSGMGN